MTARASCRLIVNADDFGLTRGINRAIAELHQTGALTSATLMANSPAFEDAVDIARASPTLGVGCHIVLVDGTPISPPEEIPTLLGPDKKSFRASLAHFVRDLVLGRIDEDELAHEALAQVQKLQRAGIDITHIDTHKHTHCFPVVARPLVNLASKTSIACLRNPFEPAFACSLAYASLTRRTQMGLLNCFQTEFDRLTVHTLTTDGTLGIAATGKLDASTLKSLLSKLPEGSLFELCCHPGYNDADLDRVRTRLRKSRDLERQALLTVMPSILSLPQPPEFIHYGMLGAFGAMRETGLFYPDTGYEKY